MANMQSAYSARARGAQLFWLLTLADFTATFTPLLKHQKLLRRRRRRVMRFRWPPLSLLVQFYTHSIYAQMGAKAFRIGMNVIEFAGVEKVLK
jgi:hypothetical protein